MSTLKVTGLANAHRRNDGYSIAQVRLLKRYPDPPAGTYYSEGGSAVTYTFNNGRVSFAGSNAGWSVTPPVGSGDLYVIYASAVSEESYDVIQPEEFTPPVILSEESTPGTPGANVCTVFIYKADNGTEAPARPSGVATYTFNGGAISGLNNGWVKDPPAGDKIWVSTATAYSSDTTDNIQGTGGEDPCEWSTPKVWKQKGDPGHDPVVTASKSGSTTTISVDGSPIASIEDGAAGVDVTDTSDQYACNDSESTVPQEADWTTFALASADLGPNSRFLWNREVVTYSDGDSDTLTPHIVFKYSENGKSLKRIDNQYAYGGASEAPSLGWDFPELIPDAQHRYVWQRERTVFDTSPETYTAWSDGHMLAMYVKGDAGVGVTNIVDQYAVNNNDAQVPQSGWDTFDNVKSQLGINNKYLWNREVVYYDDVPDTPLEAHIIYRVPDVPKNITGVDEWYAYGTISAPDDNTWDNTAPKTPSALHPYVWQKERVIFDDSTYGSFSTAHLITMWVKGDPGKGISEVKYGKSSSESSTPEDWYDSAPSVYQGEWLWVRTKYTDNTLSYTKSYIGNDGDDGISVYVKSASKVGKTTTVVLEDTTGAKTTMTIVDGDDGNDGHDGLNGYIHYAWANDNHGTDFSTSVSEGKTWIGVYEDQGSTRPADSQDYHSYSWTEIKGDPGVSITNTVDEYAVNNDDTTAPQSGWDTFDNVKSQLGPNNKYLWNREIVYYDDVPAAPLSAHIIYRVSTDAKNIKGVHQQYAYGSESAPDASSWSDSQKTPSQLHPYVWERERIIYEDDTEPTNWGTAHILTMWIKGDPGDPGAPGADGADGLNLTIFCDQETYDIDLRNPNSQKQLKFTANVSGYEYSKSQWKEGDTVLAEDETEYTKTFNSSPSSVTIRFSLLQAREESGQTVYTEVKYAVITISAIDKTEYNLCYGAIDGTSSLLPSIILDGDYFACSANFPSPTPQFYAGKAYKRISGVWSDNISLLTASEQLTCLKYLRDTGYGGVISIAWIDTLIAQSATIGQLIADAIETASATIKEAIITDLTADTATFTGKVDIKNGNEIIFNAQKGNSQSDEPISCTNAGNTPDGFLGSEAKVIIKDYLNTSARRNKLFAVNSNFFTTGQNTKIAYVNVPGNSYDSVSGAIDPYETTTPRTNYVVTEYIENEYAVPIQFNFSPRAGEISIEYTETETYYRNTGTELTETWPVEPSVGDVFYRTDPNTGWHYQYIITYVRETAPSEYLIYADAYVEDTRTNTYSVSYYGTVEESSDGVNFSEITYDFSATIQPQGRYYFRFTSPDVEYVEDEYSIIDVGHVYCSFNPLSAYGGNNDRVCIYEGTTFSNIVDNLITNGTITESKYLQLNISNAWTDIVRTYIGSATLWTPNVNTFHKLYKFKYTSPVVTSSVSGFTPGITSAQYLILADGTIIEQASGSTIQAVNIQTNSLSLTFDTGPVSYSSATFYRQYSFSFTWKHEPSRVVSRTILPAGTSDLGGSGTGEQWDDAYIDRVHSSYVEGAVFN